MVLGAPLACGDDDDDDSDDDEGGIWDDDDANVDPDDDSDDDDNGPKTETIILDDGTSEKGIGAGCPGCGVVQGFTPSHYPEILQYVEYYVRSDQGLDHPVIFNVYYHENTKSTPPDGDLPIYSSDPFHVDSQGWNLLDLTEVEVFTEHPLESGQIWIGFEYILQGGGGPYIGIDKNAVPGTDMWFWDLYNYSEGAWVNFNDFEKTTEYDNGPTYGVLMISPTLTY
jgi:hypothetical protein